MKTFTVLKGKPLSQGAVITSNGVNFSIFSKDATRVVLCFFETAGDGAPCATVEFDPVQNKTGDIWHALIPEARAGTLYLYRPYRIPTGLYDGSSNQNHIQPIPIINLQ